MKGYHFFNNSCNVFSLIFIFGIALFHTASSSTTCTSYDETNENSVCALPSLVLDKTHTLSMCEAKCAEYEWCRYVSFKKSGNAKVDAPMQCSTNGKELITSESAQFKYTETKQQGSQQGSQQESSSKSPSPSPPPNTPTPSDCINEKTVDNDCSHCLTSSQCKDGGFCCPYMKMCVKSGQQGCRGPIAGCSPPCFTAECNSCNNADYNDGKWQKQTCAGDDRRLMQHKVSMDKIVVDDVGVRQIFNNDYVQEETNIANYHRGRTLTGSIIEQDKQAFLDRHNKWRALTRDPMASNMEAVVWDDKLQLVAQNYANKCVWEHNAERSSDYQAAGGTGYVGENLAAGTYMSATLSVDMWDKEKEGYDYDTGQCSIAMCGHYTQTSWATSSKIGCGITECDDIQGAGFGGIHVVCNYAPGGNVNGRKPYKKGERGVPGPPEPFESHP